MKKVNLVVVALWVLGILAAIHFTDRYTRIEENVMAIAESTLALIEGFEGKKYTAYKDSRGLWTIGVGHLIKSSEQYLLNTTLTDQQVDDLLRSDLTWCSDAVDSSVRGNLTQSQYDALYSLCFNIGADNFKNSTVVKKLNAGDKHGAADAILMWNKPAVLMSRRQRERALFLSGI
jgi:lysozyme